MDPFDDPERLPVVLHNYVPPAEHADQNRPASGRVRVIVVLPNGSKIVIPIDLTSTVSELHAEALRRATVLQLPFDPGSVLHIGSRTGAIAFEEDPIEDVLDPADNSTFWLSSVQESSQAAGLVSFHRYCYLSWRLTD